MFTTESQFRTAVRKAWKARREGGIDIYTQRVRNLNWTKAVEIVNKDHPGSDPRSSITRERIKSAMANFAVKIFSTFQRLTPVAKKAVQEAYTNWEVDMAKRAGIQTIVTSSGEVIPILPDQEVATARGEAPSSSTDRGDAYNPLLDQPFIAKLVDKFMHSDAAQWNDVIADGINIYFLCRIIECGFVCPAIMWLKNGQGGWAFRCPACLSRYYPHVKTGGRIPASKILVWSDVVSSTLDSAIQDHTTARGEEGTNARLAAVQTTCRQLLGKNTQTLLVEWPDTSSQNLLNALSAATLGIVDELKGDTSNRTFEETEQRLLQLQAHMQHPDRMQRFTFTEAQKKWVREHNASRSGVDAGWDYSHLESGYVGFRYHYQPQEHVATHKEVVQMLALSKFVVAARSAASRL